MSAAPRKVLFVSHVPQPGSVRPQGGAARVLRGLCAELPALGWECVVVCPAEGELTGQLREAGARVLIFPYAAAGWREPLRTLGDFWRWTRLLRRERPDVIHTNAVAALGMPVAAAARLGIPVQCHTHLAWNPGEIAWAMRGAPAPAGFLFVSEAQRAESLAHCPPRFAGVPTHVLPNAVALPATTSAPPPGPPWRVGIVGNLTPQKRHEDFLAMAARLVERGHDCEFRVIGGDPQGRQAGLAAQVERLGLGARVVFEGYVADAAARLPGLHALVMCSDNESGPLVVAEAMAAARPVVATRVGAASEMLIDGESGYLVEVGDVDALTARVARLLDDRALAVRLGENARARAATALSPAAQAARLAAIYEAVLAA